MLRSMPLKNVEKSTLFKFAQTSFRANQSRLFSSLQLVAFFIVFENGQKIADQFLSPSKKRLFHSSQRISLQKNLSKITVQKKGQCTVNSKTFLGSQWMHTVHFSYLLYFADAV